MEIHIWEGAKIPLSLHFTLFSPYWRESHILREFRQKNSNTKLILNEEDTYTQIQQLRDRTTDVMFLYHYNGLFESVAAKDLIVKQIDRESLVVFYLAGATAFTRIWYWASSIAKCCVS